MPEVQNVGAMDYSTPIQQNAYSSDIPVDENMPMVYDPEMEVKKNAASSRLGATAKAALVVGGLLAAAWGGHKWGASGKSELKEANKAMKEALTDINKESKEFLGKNPVKRAFKNKEFAENIENKSKNFVDEAEKAVEEGKEKAEEAAEEAAKKK